MPSSVRKEPPPESLDAIWTRRYVVFAFWLMAICLGIPFWWKTTTVYRANLPLEAMEKWSKGEACQAIFPLPISIHAPGLADAELQKLVNTAQHALDDLNDFSAHHLRLSSFRPNANPHLQSKGRNPTSDHDLNIIDHDAILTVILAHEKKGSVATAILRSNVPILEVNYPPNMSAGKDPTFATLASFIAGQLDKVFAEEQATIRHLIFSNSGIASPVGGSALKSNDLQAQLQVKADRRNMRSMKYAPTYHVTFSLLTPDATPSAWDIEEALGETFRPFLELLKPISNFTVDSQVQPYATFSPSVQPVEDQARRAWLLQRSDLAGFINAAEWPLSPSIDDGPTINFVVFVPSQSQAPLLVNASSSNSWLVPQWGGITIFNPSEKSSVRQTGKLTASDLEESLLIFSAHLLTLLGLPSTPASLPLRISSQTRILSLRLLHSASSTLGSLTRLTQQLTSISIPKSVAASVEATLVHLDRACAAVRKGEFQTALDDARTAEGEIETAFFDKHMVGQVYFPEEHKVAVYLPLLGPVAVPLVLSGIKELRAWILSMRQTRG